MSAETAAWALRQNPGNPGAKLLLVVLVDYSTETGEVSPTQKSLAERTNQSERAVRGHLASLEDAGYITRIRQTRADGMRGSDKYQLNLAAEYAYPTNGTEEDKSTSLPADSAAQKLLLKDKAITTIDNKLNPSGLGGDTPRKSKTRRTRTKNPEPDEGDASVALGIWAQNSAEEFPGEVAPPRHRKPPGVDTPLGLAAYWSDKVATESKGWGAVLLGPANRSVLAKYFKDWMGEGVSPDEIRAMSDLYAESYLGQLGDRLAWKDFLAKRKLLLDKIRPSEDAWATDHHDERTVAVHDYSDFYTHA